MPTLNKITCSIELGPSNTKLKDYGTRYSDSYVETCIAVPDTDLPFSIHLTSEGYIAPGLAFFVFIDGEYQCNRNRTELKMPGEGVDARDYETDFRVRQKEEKTTSGNFVVRDWTFAKLNRVAADKAPNLNPQFTSNVGTIEVIVLRCKAAPEEVLPPQTYNRRKTRTAQKQQTPSKHSAPSVKPTSKPISPLQSELGGLFGLFDGACDRKDLNVTSRDDADERNNKQFLHSFTLDGTGDPPGVIINQYTSRGNGSGRRGWCQSPKHDSRNLYNDDSPSEDDAANAKFMKTLEDLRSYAEDYVLKHQGNPSTSLEATKVDLSIIQQLLSDLQGPLQSQVDASWVRDLFKDIEVMRRYVEALQKQYVTNDFTRTMGLLAQHQIEVLRDKRYRTHYNDTVEDCRKLRMLFDERIEALQNFLQQMGRPDTVDVTPVQRHMDNIRKQRTMIDNIIQSMRRREQMRDHRAKQFDDGASVHKQNKWEGHNDPRTDKSSWHEVGVGRWGPKSGIASAQGPNNLWENNQRPTDNQPVETTPWWAAPAEQANPDYISKSDSKDKQKRNLNLWDSLGNQDNGQRNWIGDSKKTTEHNFGEGKTQSRKSNAGWQPDNDANNGWETNGNGNVIGNNDDWDNAGVDRDNNTGRPDQGQGNRDWQADELKSKVNDNWMDGSQKTDRSRSASSIGGKDSESGANARIKSYWADWNKPFDRNTSQSTQAKQAHSPRPVYNYPAAPLPALPESKTKDRSFGMQASRGADYSHKCRKPIYIDSMEAPYAVFRFKYRSKDVLENILKRKIDGAEVEKIKQQAERHRLACMPKEKLIGELMNRGLPGGGLRKNSTFQASGPSKGWDAEPAPDTGGNGWDKQSKADDHWAAPSDGSKRSARRSNKNTPAAWDNNPVTNSGANGWGDNGGGNAAGDTLW